MIDLLVQGTREERIEVCRINPFYFAIYYFPEFFVYQSAPFHEHMYRDYVDLMDGTLREAAWIMFRESAKTSIAKICLTHAICFQQKKYINVDSYDKQNAEALLFDVVLWLQTNDAIKADFGELYNARRSPDEVQRKRVADFLTNNGIRVEAHSTQESMRGRVFQQFRPDFIILDDFENSKTITSAAYTQKVIDHIDEMMAGLAPEACVLYLGNYLSESGSVAHIMERAKRDNRVLVRNVPIVLNDKPTWPGKYVMNDADKLKSGNEKKVSIEERRRMIDNFEAEMMNNPTTSSEVFFDRAKVESGKLRCVEKAEDVAGLHLWDQYKSYHRYSIGADSSEGVGQDANTAVIIDHEYAGGKAAVIGTYVNNTIAPDIFGHELVRMGYQFGACLVAPEVNNTGHATVAALKSVNYPKIYQERNEIVVNAQRPSHRLGWRTTSGNKYNAFFQFKRAFEDGDLLIFDERLINEMLYYSLVDLRDEKNVGMATRHFDLLMAAVIAWAVRAYAVHGEPEGTEYEEPVNYMASQPL